MFFSTVIFYLFPVLLRPISSEFGWSRAQVAGGFSLLTAGAALSAPFWGRLFDRRTPTPIVAACLAASGSSIAALSIMPASLAVFWGLFVAIGVTTAGTTALAYARLLSNWFDRRRGAAFGLLLAGAALGGIVVPPLAQTIVSSFDWRVACRISGLSLLVLAAPIVLTFVRERDLSVSVGQAAAPPVVTPVLRALATRRFWILFLMIFVAAIANGGMLAHLVALLTDRGVSAARATSSIAVLGAATLLGRLVAGWLLDRLAPARLAAALLAFAAAGSAVLARADDLGTALAGAALLGLGVGGELDVAPYLLSRYFGIASLSSLYGFFWSAHGLGSAAGALVLGRTFDRLGSYGPALDPIAVANFAIALLLLTLPDPRRPAS